MQRYEFRKGSSNKFWEVDLRGLAVVTRFGRIGSAGTQHKKPFSTAAKAQRAHDRLVSEKTTKGYLPIRARKTVSIPRAARGDAGSSSELEAAIAAEPGGVDAYLVYGDWLQSQGDPRGELIALQHARMQKPNDKTLEKAEKAFLKQHADHLYGPLARAASPGMNKSWGRAPFFAEWHLGFFRSARLGWNAGLEMDTTAYEMLPQLLGLPSARFLRELSFGQCDGGGLAYAKLLAQLGKLKSKVPATLARVCLGDYARESGEFNWTEVGPIAPLYKALPKLQNLELYGRNIGLGKMDLPELRELSLSSSDPSREDIFSALKQSRLPKLERLSIRIPDIARVAEGLKAILSAKFPALRHLELEWASLTRDDIQALAKGAFPGLRTLSLPSNALTDTKAAVLAELAGTRFAHLEWIDFHNNLLSARGQKLLAKLCPDVRFGKQQKPDDLFEWGDD